jgi:hypothetical protein
MTQRRLNRQLILSLFNLLTEVFKFTTVNLKQVRGLGARVLILTSTSGLLVASGRPAGGVATRQGAERGLGWLPFHLPHRIVSFKSS